jgi:hypothetical protein
MLTLPPTELVLPVLRNAVLPPLTIAAGVLAVVLGVGGRRFAAAGAALALAAGVAAGNHFQEAMPLKPEKAAWHWLPWVALEALLIGLLTRRPEVPAVLGWLLRATTAAGAALLLMPEAFRAEAWWHLWAFAAVVLILWGLLEYAADHPPGGALPLGLALAFLGSATILLHAHSARLADIAVMTASGLSGIAVIAWWAKTGISGAMPAAAVLLPGVLLAGYTETFSDVPWTSFLVAGAAPLVLLPTLLPPLSRWSGWRLRLVQLGLLLVPVVYAVTRAMQAESIEFE